MKFDYSWDSSQSNVDPQYSSIYGGNQPALRAQGTLTYLEFIDVVQRAWALGNPEIEFIPFAGNTVYNPEKGYIVYSLVDRETKENSKKPTIREILDDANISAKRVIIFSQSFINYIKFTAIHQNPRIAEELIEAFEDFMMQCTHTFKRLGLEQIQYGRRASDEHLTRYGDDAAARSIIYVVVTQKVLYQEMERLEEIFLHVRPVFPATPNILYY